jgi:glycine oxidase
MRIIVVGGGVIGLSAAWRLARDGNRVTVLDGAPGASEASWAAAGMLAPHHEARAADSLWRLGVHALACWPRFAADLGGAEALDFRLIDGLVPLASSEDAAREAARAGLLAAAGVPCRLIAGEELRRQAPALAGDLVGALLIPGGQVDPRRLLRALQGACAHAGAEVRYGAAVAAIRSGGVVLTGGEELHAELVVVASGAWSVALAASTGLALSGEPVKGQMVRLAAPDDLLAGFIHGHHGYLVPRRGQGVVVGASMVEAGFDKSEDAEVIARLVAAARRLVPRLAEAAVVETWTGLRPRLSGGQPLIARVQERLIVATGHFRNGILLSAATAEIIADLASGRDIPAVAQPFATLAGRVLSDCSGATTRPPRIGSGAMDGGHPDR